uniref:Si:dkeyp-110g5.4 n=2 Tax=Iconisemion striatum TaxID=60296 RepID=A0A1A7WCA3_9TELE
MDVHKELDVYIPKAAEVKILPLQSLPKSVLRKMGLAGGDASRMSADVIWICPAVLRRKDQGPASAQPRDSAENPNSLLGVKFQAGSAPLQMSFVSSSRAAWEVLSNISSGAQFSKTQLLRQDSAPLVSQNAVVIHNGLVYLCIRRSTEKQGQPKTRELQTSSRSSEPPSGTSKQVLLSDGRPDIKHAAGKIKPSVVLKRKVGSTVGSEGPAHQPSGSQHNKDEPFVKIHRPEPVLEEAALQPVLVPPQEDRRITTSSYEMHDVGEEDAPGTAWNDPDTQTDSPGADRTWTRIESSAGPSSMLGDYDFTVLENEERIAQLRAKLMQDTAAFNSSAMF